MKKILNEGNQTHNFMSSSGSGTIINYGSGSDFLTCYGSSSGSTSQKVTAPTVPVPQRCQQPHTECIPFHHQQYGQAGCIHFHRQRYEHTRCISLSTTGNMDMQGTHSHHEQC
jgi:hypothetical protein